MKIPANAIYIFCILMLFLFYLYCYFEKFIEKYIFRNPRRIVPFQKISSDNIPISLVVEQ